MDRTTSTLMRPILRRSGRYPEPVVQRPEEPGPMTEITVRGRNRTGSRAQESSLSAAQDKVRAFHVAMRVEAPSGPISLDSYPGELRCALIAEEVEELGDAFQHGDIYGAIDAICDILYVAYGAAVALGEPLGRDHPVDQGTAPSDAVTFRIDDFQSVSRRSREFVAAWSARRRGAMLRSLTRLVDDVYATAAHLGVNVRPFFDEVHQSNMAKLGGPVRHDGKI